MSEGRAGDRRALSLFWRTSGLSPLRAPPQLSFPDERSEGKGILAVIPHRFQNLVCSYADATNSLTPYFAWGSPGMTVLAYPRYDSPWSSAPSGLRKISQLTMKMAALSGPRMKPFRPNIPIRQVSQVLAGAFAFM